jgi:hypothetical protein
LNARDLARFKPAAFFGGLDVGLARPGASTAGNGRACSSLPWHNAADDQQLVAWVRLFNNSLETA